MKTASSNMRAVELGLPPDEEARGPVQLPPPLQLPPGFRYIPPGQRHSSMARALLALGAVREEAEDSMMKE